MWGGVTIYTKSSHFKGYLASTISNNFYHLYFTSSGITEFANGVGVEEWSKKGHILTIWQRKLLKSSMEAEKGKVLVGWVGSSHKRLPFFHSGYASATVCCHIVFFLKFFKNWNNTNFIYNWKTGLCHFHITIIAQIIRSIMTYTFKP